MCNLLKCCISLAETLLMKKINLSIPKPCHESWNQMTQVEKGKFCASCQKTVVDFTNMSDRQLAEFFKKSIGSTCGRFQADQLGRDIAIPKKRIPWIKYFFQFSIPAFLISVKATAQKRKVLGDTTYCTETMGLVSKNFFEKLPDTKTISGKIINEDGQVVPHAIVQVKYNKDAVQADNDGVFQINAKPNSILIFSALGYNAKEVLLKNDSDNLTVVFQKSDYALAGEVVVVGYTIKKKPKKMPLIKKIVDTGFKKFSVYPNPVQRNSNMKIDLRKLEEGQYTISIISTSGEVVQTEEIIIEIKTRWLIFILTKRQLELILFTCLIGKLLLRIPKKLLCNNETSILLNRITERTSEP